MRHQPPTIGCGALLLITMFSGCAADVALDAHQVLGHDQCHGLQAGISRVTWSDVAAIRGSQLLGMTEDPAAESEGDLLMIAISRGQQPTAGYGLRLQRARREADTAVIEVEWTVPPPDALVAQMITHPCLVVGLPDTQAARVLVRDQHGADLGELAL